MPVSYTLEDFLIHSGQLATNLESVLESNHRGDITDDEARFAINTFVDHFETNVGRVEEGSGGSGGSGDIDFDALYNQINAMYQGLGNYMYEMEDRILKRVTAVGTTTAGTIMASLQNQTGILSNQNTQIVGLINAVLSKPDNGVGIGIEQLNSVINNLEGKVLGGIDGLSNQVDSQLRSVQNNVIQNISNSTETISNEIRNIQGTSGNTGNSGNGNDSTVNLAFYNALLDLFSQILSAMTISGVKTEITNFDELPELTSGSSGETDTNTSGNIGFDIGSAIASFFSEVGETVSVFNTLSVMYNNLIAGKYTTYQEFENDVKELGSFRPIVGTALDIIQGILIITTGFYKYSQPFTNNIETLARTAALDSILSPDILVTALFRSLMGVGEVTTEFHKLGYDDNQISTILKVSQVPFRENYLQEAFLKGLISRSELDNGMIKLGYQRDDLDMYVKLYENIPPYTDLIRFAVREAYDENAVKRLDLDAEYDLIKDRFEKDMKAQGIFEPYPRMLWRSHWQLPSPTQGYEMLHRGEITEDELANLLKASDYAPTWREKLMNIAYANYTRVDIRRMHDVGVLNDEEVYEAYLALGYNKDRARNMQEFTLKLNAKEKILVERDLTQSKYEQAYKYNLIDKFKFASEMNKLGYSDEEINLLIELIDYTKQASIKANVTDDNKRRIASSVQKSYIEGVLPRNRVESFLRNIGYNDTEVSEEITYLDIEREILLANLEIELIQKSYVEFSITREEVFSAMSGYGYQSSEIDKIIRLWDQIRNNRNTHPTKAELSRWLKKGVIGDIELDRILKGMGYSDKTISYYFEDFYPSEDK